MAPLSSILGGQVTTESPKTLAHARFLDAPPLHLPHTISSRTITSVATNTSRVSPTLCHILRADGWTRTQRRMAGRLGDMGGGRPRAAPQGAGLGGAGAAAAGSARRRALPPPTGATESWEERAGREAPLPPHRSGEPGPRRAEAGGERTRCHGGH